MQRLHAVILFADLSSATSLGETIDPEFFAEIIGEIRNVAEKVIEQYNGVLNQFYGDGILSAFGIPEASKDAMYEDAIYNAAVAALELHHKVRNLPRHPKLPPHFNLMLHSGIHSGLVVSAEGDKVQGRYKITGDALNTAARLSDQAEPDQIIISAETLQSEKPFFKTKKLPPLYLQGKVQPLEAYLIEGLSKVKTRYEARVKMGLTSYAGRKAEHKLLHELEAKSRGGSFQTANLIGDSGVGKSRLAQEFLNTIKQTQDQHTFNVFCRRNSPPLQVFAELFSKIFGISSNESNADIQGKIETKLKQFNITNDKIKTDLKKLFVIEESDISKEKIVEYSFSNTIATILREISKNETIILFFDDFHFVDEHTKIIFSDLQKALSNCPIFTITTSRSGTGDHFLLSGKIIQIHPLNFKDSTDIVSSLFSTNIPDQDKKELYEMSGGNPLFLEELCKTILSNVDRKSPPGPPCTSAFNRYKEDKIPSTLHLLTAKRINNLPVHIATILNCAAIAGKEIDIVTLETLLGRSLSESDIRELAENDLLYRTDNNRSLRFKHGVTRNAIYESVNVKEKQKTHEQYAKIIEQRSKNEGRANDWEELAYHFDKAGKDKSCGLYSELSGNKALSSSVLDRARYFFSMALNKLDPEFKPDNSYDRWKSILSRLGWACVFDPSPDQLSYLERAIYLAKKNSDHHGLLKAEFWLGYVHYALGEPEKALTPCSNVLTAAQVTGNKQLIADSRSILAQTYVSTCEYDKADNLFSKIPGISDEIEPKKYANGAAYTIACKALKLGDQGKLNESYAEFERALKVVSLNENDVAGSVLSLYSAVKLWQENWTEAKKLANTAREKAQSITSTYVFAMANAQHAYANWKIHNDENSVDILLDTTRWLEKQGKHLFMSINYAWLCDVMMKKNNHHKVRSFAAKAILRARKKDLFGEAMAYRCLAKLAALNKNFSATEKYLNLAMKSALFRGSKHEILYIEREQELLLSGFRV